MNFKPRLLILDWQGFCRRIWAMSALNSRAHCKFRKCLNLLQYHWNDRWWWWRWLWWIRGYTAPEYAINGHLSEKVDIYSFGVVVLEIISGQRCSDLHTNSDSNSNPSYLLDEVHFSLYKRHVSVMRSPKMAKRVRFSKINTPYTAMHRRGIYTSVGCIRN